MGEQALEKGKMHRLTTQLKGTKQVGISLTDSYCENLP